MPFLFHLVLAFFDQFRRWNVSTVSKAYKSPLPKLVDFFKSSRDKWKAKHTVRKRENKRLANQVAAVEKSRERWRSECKELRGEVASLKKQLSDLEKKC